MHDSSHRSELGNLIFTAFTLLFALVSSPARCQGNGQKCTVQNVYAWVDSTHDIQVRWTTTQPTKGRVEYGLATPLLQSVPEDASSLRGTTNNHRDPGIGWANNHRATIPAPRQWPQTVKISVETREGSTSSSDSIRISPAPAPVTPLEKGIIPLKLDFGDWHEDAPFTAGVPFPQGLLWDPASLTAVLDGVPVHTQIGVVTRWRKDGSIKWARLDFIAPTDTQTAAVRYGIPENTPMQKTHADPPQSPMLKVTLHDGTVLDGTIETCVAEETGPVKTVWCSEGQFGHESTRSDLTFIIRQHIWQGHDFSRFDVTFENRITHPEMTSIRSLAVLFPVGDTQNAYIGTDKGEIAVTPGTRLIQQEDFEWISTSADLSGRHLNGHFTAADLSLTVTHFWEQWPIGWTLAENHVAVELCPQLPQKFYANRPDEDRLYYQIRDGLHTFRQGFTKTWEVWTGMEEPGLSVNTKPVAGIDPEWIEKSRTLGVLAIPTREDLNDYDTILQQSVSQMPEARVRKRELGMMNFGDWYGERRWNWGNLEYDLGHGLLTQFVRTGDAQFWREADLALRHQRDVDTRHYADDPRRVGQQWIHSMGHTAGYYDNDYKHMKCYAGTGWSDNRGHVWSQGMFEHYLLGGDRRSWKTARLISDWAAGPQTTNFTFGNAREPGWMTKLVMGAYMATEDPYYLNAAKLMLEETHRKALASGDHGFFYHPLPKGHCNCPDGERHSGEAGFMLGVLMTGMKMYYDATADPVVADDIVKTAHFIVDTMWEEDEMAFHYTSCPKSSVPRTSAWIMLEGLTFAALRSGDPELTRVCRYAFCSAWGGLSSSGKLSGYVLCSSAKALAGICRLPGPDMSSTRREVHELLHSPARAPMPTAVPNPGFETTIEGWPSRGWQIEASTDVFHSGRRSLRISGTHTKQNEFVNTAYDASGSPYEITSLKPGQTYRLAAWLRVDALTEGRPAPSLRVAFRDISGTRDSASTSSYNLAEMGTWQRLDAVFRVPEYNTRNYIALNTNSKESIEVDMYLDDVSVIPESSVAKETYTSVVLLPADAVRLPKIQTTPCKQFGGDLALMGPGNISWPISLSEDGEFRLWMRVGGGSTFGRITIDNREVAGKFFTETPDWADFGEVELSAGKHSIAVENLTSESRIGTIVLTQDPSSAR